ncbi:tectonic-1 [Diorhabda sublineata]|uniref:tectonic-1 n=1 Tax=Diorhabda sublineata TaxID=1163346 RepID=UPI0024E0F27C|nr:tectonic-1 [Diorhabda sublineata]
MFCDINCCCDEDCSTENKEVFQYCLPEPRFFDARFCDYMKYIYINNTPVQWHINQNGMFCIIKSNYPKSYILQRIDPIKNFDESQMEKTNKFSWSKLHSDTNEDFNSSLKLMYGTPIWLLSRRGFHKFGIPNSFVRKNCLIKEEVFYLKNFETECFQTDLIESNPNLNLQNYYENIFFLSHPMLIDIKNWKEKIIENCPENVCLSIVPKVCDETFNNCEYILKNNTERITTRCNFAISSKMNTCYNIVKKLKYNIFHNGTKGIISVSLLAVMANITYEFGENPFEFKQEFSVNFLWENNKEKAVISLSGNPGYLIGKPILISRLLEIKNGTDLIMKIERNITNNLESVYVIPKTFNGDCLLNKSEFTNLEFGYNLLNKCKFQTTVYNDKKIVNATELCRAIQGSILNVWNIKNNTMVGLFGNANAMKFDDWQKILYKIDPDSLMNSTIGLYSSKKSYIFCRNLISELEIDIFHSKVDIDSLLNQEKILALSISFGGFTNKSLYYRKNSSSVYFESELKTFVTFYDLTAKKERLAASPPSLNMKLPYDFFYPFVRVNNGSVGVKFYLFAILLCLNVVFV